MRLFALAADRQPVSIDAYLHVFRVHTGEVSADNVLVAANEGLDGRRQRAFKWPDPPTLLLAKEASKQVVNLVVQGRQFGKGSPRNQGRHRRFTSFPERISRNAASAEIITLDELSRGQDASF
ncbi:hypothetical protein HRbin30_03023 [bacterium HR30]|nr:hypothetical protein HRbin30_03023 [bacterium HR30]